MQPQQYEYVGPESIKRSSATIAPGTAITSSAELLAWLQSQFETDAKDDRVTATFVIDLSGTLRLANQRSEHVACAGGADVLSAGELVFAREGDVLETSNQSTGYCPEPESWSHVAAALDTFGVSHPAGFTREIQFRRCPVCSETNIVKDGWFFCALCDAELPREWNYAN